jgi:hypothetical protein
MNGKRITAAIQARMEAIKILNNPLCAVSRWRQKCIVKNNGTMLTCYLCGDDEPETQSTIDSLYHTAL